MRNTKEMHHGEEVIFETRPRFFMYLQSALIKFILIILIIYLFRSIVFFTANIQNNLINYVQIPLVQAVTILLLLIVLFLIISIIWNLLSWKYTKYILTNSRIIFKKGVIRKNKTYIHYDKIQDITVSQSLTERISSSGDIEIFSGHDYTQLILKDVPNPANVEDIINRLIEGDISLDEPAAPKKIKSSVIDEHKKKFKR